MPFAPFRNFSSMLLGMWINAKLEHEAKARKGGITRKSLGVSGAGGEPTTSKHLQEKNTGSCGCPASGFLALTNPSVGQRRSLFLNLSPLSMKVMLFTAFKEGKWAHCLPCLVRLPLTHSNWGTHYSNINTAGSLPFSFLFFPRFWVSLVLLVKNGHQLKSI